ncbi:MAG: hypothetical protein FK733_09120 [Asgard group archaeon]|nr:hypothetical protein [Asgard group archaeon]
MKEKLISLTEKLLKAGFQIEGIEVESREMVRIKFMDIKGLELLVNGDFAKITAGECKQTELKKLEKIIKKDYTLKDNLDAFEEDMFSKLLNAS